VAAGTEPTGVSPPPDPIENADTLPIALGKPELAMYRNRLSPADE
jgi:hypothetical protein